MGRPWISSCSFAKATSEPENEIAPISAERMIETLMSPCNRPEAGARLWNSASEISAAAPPPTPLHSATICAIAVIFTRRLLPLPEHLEHPVGDHEAADHVGRGEHDRNQPDHGCQRVLVAEPRDEHGADDHDPVNRVGAGHQRRVQQRRHFRDHLESEENRKDENRDLEREQQAMTHAASASSRLASWGKPCFPHVPRSSRYAPAAPRRSAQPLKMRKALTLQPLFLASRMRTM